MIAIARTQEFDQGLTLRAVENDAARGDPRRRTCKHCDGHSDISLATCTSVREEIEKLILFYYLNPRGFKLASATLPNGMLCVEAAMPKCFSPSKSI